MQNVSVVYEAQDVVIDQGAILEGPKKVRSRKWRQENNEILYIYIGGLEVFQCRIWLDVG